MLELPQLKISDGLAKKNGEGCALMLDHGKTTLIHASPLDYIGLIYIYAYIHTYIWMDGWMDGWIAR